MKLGGENKKAVWALVLLGGGALYSAYNAFLAGPSIPTSSSASSASGGRPSDTSSSLAASADAAAAAQANVAHRAPATRNGEFSPKLTSKNAEDRIDVTKIDPTLRLDLLARLEKVPAPAGTHNLFQVGTPPAKPEPPKGPETVVKVVAWNRFPQPLPPPPGPPPPPPPKVAVAINVKYYGWAEPSGTSHRRAFFLDGDNIIICGEGEAIKGHYRVVHIDANRVVIEDNNDKLQQTLTKVEEGA